MPQELSVSGNQVVSGNATVAGNMAVTGNLQVQGTFNYLPAGVVMQFAGAAAPQGWLLCDGSAVSRTTYQTLFAAVGTMYGEGDGAATFNLPNMCGRTTVGCDTSQTEFNALGKTGGEKAHALSLLEIPSHTHTGTSAVAGQHYHGMGTYGNNNGVFPSLSVAYTTPPNPSGSKGTSWNGSGGGSVNNLTNPPANGRLITTTVISDPAGNGHSHTLSIAPAGGNNGATTPHNNLQPYIVMNYIIKY
jgi:microcystin-dependent protein